jgi:hypothetical protein
MIGVVYAIAGFVVLVVVGFTGGMLHLYGVV